MIKYLKNVLYSLDLAANSILFLGDPRETISSRCGKYVYSNKGLIPCVLCKLLDLYEKDHCLKNVDRNVGGYSVIWENDPAKKSNV